VTWLASRTVGSSWRPSASTDVSTWSFRLDVAIAHAMPASLIAATTPATPGSGRGALFSLS
jgi:hypothetical protein